MQLLPHKSHSTLLLHMFCLCHLLQFVFSLSWSWNNRSFMCKLLLAAITACQTSQKHLLHCLALTLILTHISSTNWSSFFLPLNAQSAICWYLSMKAFKQVCVLPANIVTRIIQTLATRSMHPAEVYYYQILGHHTSSCVPCSHCL